MFTEKVIPSIIEIAQYFRSRAVIFLNESDLESSLSNSIRSKFNSGITINTQTPWYDTYVTNKSYVIDITGFDTGKLQITFDPVHNRKGYRYEDEALAMELKFFRYNEDIQAIAEDFYKISLLINAPKNECFIVAGARNTELFDRAEIFMRNQVEEYRNQYNGEVRVFLFGPEKLIELK